MQSRIAVFAQMVRVVARVSFKRICAIPVTPDTKIELSANKQD